MAMSPLLTPETFGKLLACLDADRERAGEKYEQLRRTLIRFFEWRGAPFPEEHADETFDRVSRKLGDRVEIANIGGYCYEVARLICLEALKGPHRRSVSLDSSRLPVDVPTAVDETSRKELRQACLENCLSDLPEESRDVILEYYRDDRHARIDRRRVLAQRLGLQRDALANRAQRVRNKLEQCVRLCLGRQSAI
jgi:DNA-directed RNA polymerase specialized sigma24 family protein